MQFCFSRDPFFLSFFGRVSKKFVTASSTLLHSKFFVRIVEIYRRNDESLAEIKSTPLPIFHRVPSSVCLVQGAWIFKPKRLWLSIRLKYVSDLKDWRKWQVNRDRELSVVAQRFRSSTLALLIFFFLSFFKPRIYTFENKSFARNMGGVISEN